MVSIVNWEDAVNAVVDDPEMREPLRQELSKVVLKTPGQLRLLRLLDSLERVDPQTPEGRAHLAEAEESAAASEARRRAEERSNALKHRGMRLKARVKAQRERLAERDRLRQALAEEGTGGWG